MSGVGRVAAGWIMPRYEPLLLAWSRVCKAGNTIKRFESVDHDETCSFAFIPFPQWQTILKALLSFLSGSANRRPVQLREEPSGFLTCP